jgi:hypothetical protein
MSELVPEKFSARPTIVEAVQWDGSAAAAGPIINWVLENDGSILYYETNETEHRQHAELRIRTVNGVVSAVPGHWIIKGQVDFYPCDPETFASRWMPMAIHP